MTLTKGQGQPMSHHFEGLSTDYLLASIITTVNNVRDIVKKWIFSKFLVNTVTLTKGQGHQMSHHFLIYLYGHTFGHVS